MTDSKNWKRRPDHKGKVHLMNDHTNPGPHRACNPWTPSPVFTETICGQTELPDNIHKLEGQKVCKTCLGTYFMVREAREKVMKAAT